MAELIGSGVELMLIGMGIVFLFLAMLVIAINLMSALVQRFFPEPPVTPVTLPMPTANTGNMDKNIVAAISVAVHQYRNKHNNQVN